MANERGSGGNQKKVSQLEDKETVEPNLLEEVARALKVPVEAIENFSEEAAINIVQVLYVIMHVQLIITVHSHLILLKSGLPL